MKKLPRKNDRCTLVRQTTKRTIPNDIYRTGKEFEITVKYMFGKTKIVAADGKVYDIENEYTLIKVVDGSIN